MRRGAIPPDQGDKLPPQPCSWQAPHGSHLVGIAPTGLLDLPSGLGAAAHYLDDIAAAGTDAIGHATGWVERFRPLCRSAERGAARCKRMLLFAFPSRSKKTMPGCLPCPTATHDSALGRRAWNCIRPVQKQRELS